MSDFNGTLIRFRPGISGLPTHRMFDVPHSVPVMSSSGGFVGIAALHRTDTGIDFAIEFNTSEEGLSIADRSRHEAFVVEARLYSPRHASVSQITHVRLVSAAEVAAVR